MAVLCPQGLYIAGLGVANIYGRVGREPGRPEMTECLDHETKSFPPTISFGLALKHASLDLQSNDGLEYLLVVMHI